MNRREKILAIIEELRKLLDELEYEVELLEDIDVYPQDIGT